MLMYVRFIKQRKHGWRHAKRPGVDEFLETLCQVLTRVMICTKLLEL